jgi:hypothetical protein
MKRYGNLQAGPSLIKRARGRFLNDGVFIWRNFEKWQKEDRVDGHWERQKERRRVDKKRKGE